MPPSPPTADGPKMSSYGWKSSRRRPTVDWAVAELAAEQHGVVGIRQLARLGLGAHLVDRRVTAGRLHRIHHGVFAVGNPRLTSRGELMAAVLACEEGAVISHRSAVGLWGLRENNGSPTIDVTAPNRRGRSPSGIAAHRDGRLSSSECTTVDGIPCTTVARSLLDFAGVARPWELRKAVSEAEVLRLLDIDAVRRLIRRHRGRRGVARLRVVLDEIHPETKRTRSELERLLLDACSKSGLPRPEVNVKLRVGNERLEPDFLWREAGLIVEADSRRFHDTYSAFQRDRKREQRLQVAGWRVSRCTWEQVEREPQTLVRTIRALLDLAADGPKMSSYGWKSSRRRPGG